jgi:hypothetical protein
VPIVIIASPAGLIGAEAVRFSERVWTLLASTTICAANSSVRKPVRLGACNASNPR